MALPAGNSKRKAQKKIRRRKKIILAVTGHRILKPNDPQVRASIKKECRALREIYPDNKFVILTGLAEGADRLVAKIAMKELKAELIVVLAVPEESFMMDFATAQSRRVFRSQLAKANHVITAPLLSKKAWQSNSPSRNHQYAWEGAFLARHADVLFALWDGSPAKGVGGTAHVVRWFKRGHIPERYLVRSDVLARKAEIPVSGRFLQKHLIHIEV